MKKTVKRVFSLVLICALLLGGTLVADKLRLRRELIRLHVVAASDSDGDQAVKLRVRDAVLACIREGLEDMEDAGAARQYIGGHLSQITAAANEALAAAGSSHRAVVTLTEEAFPMRQYDTFSLPSGVYESLRVVIGSGEGHNWWCVVFPALCVPATSDGFSDKAVSAGFSDPLTGALAGEAPYELRFFLLDCLGRLENFFH